MGQKPSAMAFCLACQGGVADVRLSPEAKVHYQQVLDGTDENSVKRKVQLARYFREFCDHLLFFNRLSDLKFKNEGNFSDGLGGHVTIWTFKAWKWRLYGAILQVNGRRCFVGVNVDPAKKQDKADQQMLKSTAKVIAGLQEYRN
jgi:hypothetical protein